MKDPSSHLAIISKEIVYERPVSIKNRTIELEVKDPFRPTDSGHITLLNYSNGGYYWAGLASIIPGTAFRPSVGVRDQEQQAFDCRPPASSKAEIANRLLPTFRSL